MVHCRYGCRVQSEERDCQAEVGLASPESLNIEDDIIEGNRSAAVREWGLGRAARLPTSLSHAGAWTFKVVCFICYLPCLLLRFVCPSGLYTSGNPSNYFNLWKSRVSLLIGSCSFNIKLGRECSRPCTRWLAGRRTRISWVEAMKVMAQLCSGNPSYYPGRSLRTFRECRCRLFSLQLT